MLDGNGMFLSSSDEKLASQPEITANILAAENGRVGDESDIYAD